MRPLSMPDGICMRPFAAMLLYIVMLVVAAGGTVLAQSGRKTTDAPTDAPAPPTSSESSAKATRARRVTTPAPRRFNLVVVKHIPSTNVAFWTNMAYRRFVERLRESPDLDVTEGKEMNRKEAIDLSKSEERRGAHVVWLELEVDVETGDTEKATATPINSGCLFIRYIMFAPGSGKVEAQGKVYQDGYQSVCVGTPSRPSPLPPFPGPSSRRPTDYTLGKAAREAAGRILDALHD